MEECQHRYVVIDDDPGDIELVQRLLADMSKGQAEMAAFTDVDMALS